MATEKVLSFSTHSFFKLKNEKKNLDNKEYGGLILPNLSKPFDTINYDVLRFSQGIIKIYKKLCKKQIAKNKHKHSF